MADMNDSLSPRAATFMASLKNAFAQKKESFNLNPATAYNVTPMNEVSQSQYSDDEISERLYDSSSDNDETQYDVDLPYLADGPPKNGK